MKNTLDKEIYFGDGMCLRRWGESGFMITHMNNEGFPKDTLYLTLAEALSLRYALDSCIMTETFE